MVQKYAKFGVRCLKLFTSLKTVPCLSASLLNLGTLKDCTKLFVIFDFNPSLLDNQNIKLIQKTIINKRFRHPRKVLWQSLS